MYKKSFIFCLFVFVCSLSGQNINKYNKLDWRIYHSVNWKDYVDYRSEEWKSMSTIEKMSLFQIPNKELHKMNTLELIEATVNSYFTRGIGKYNTMKPYYKEIYNNFNGFRELIKRKDISHKIIDYYAGLDVKTNTLSKWGLSTKEQIQYLEFLIGSPKILTKFNRNELDRLFYYLREKYSSKIKMMTIYNKKDMISSVYALAKVLERKDSRIRTKLYSVDQINLFLSSGIFLSKKTYDQILNICNKL